MIEIVLSFGAHRASFIGLSLLVLVLAVELANQKSRNSSTKQKWVFDYMSNSPNISLKDFWAIISSDILLGESTSTGTPN